MEDATRAAQVAWAAGLFEGEGCVSSSRHPSGKWCVQARLGMTDEDPVRRFAGIMGVGRVRGPIQSKRPNEKPVYEWYVKNAPGVLAVITLLSPWLGQRRSARAAEVAKIAETIAPSQADRTACPRGHRYEGENLRLDVNAAGVVRRVCRTCDNARARQRQRLRKGIPPERWRVA